MNLLVRRATLADRARVIEIVFDTLRAYGVEPEPQGLDADVMQFGDGHDESFELVATLDDEVVGVSALGNMGPGRGWVSKVFVAAHARRCGVARALMATIVTEARRRGMRRLELQTRHRFVEAIALYEGLGWKREGCPSSGPCERTYSLTLD